MLRGINRYLRRVVEDLSDVFSNFKGKNNKEVKVMLGVREIKIYEIVYPKPANKVIKEKIKEIVARHKHVGITFLGTKRDKFFRGVEFL